MTEQNTATVEQKLDLMNKILLATGTINYMANALYSVYDYKHIVISDKMPFYDIHKASLDNKESALAKALTQLNVVIEDLANCLNDSGATCAIDIRVSKVPLEILLHGKDNVYEYYDDETETPKS